jgi:hypothetical protein
LRGQQGDIRRVVGTGGSWRSGGTFGTGHTGLTGLTGPPGSPAQTACGLGCRSFG